MSERHRFSGVEYEALRGLDSAERQEVIEAVHSGRAVARPELASAAAGYAGVWRSGAGPRLYLKWYYWVCFIAATSLAYSAAGWWFVAVVALCMFLGPWTMIGRVRTANRSLRLNQELIDGSNGAEG